MLPASGFTRDASGRVPEATLTAYITTLLQQENALPPTALSSVPANASEYATKTQALRTKINDEFCYYYRRYTYILPMILQKAVSASKTVLDADTDYNTMKTNAIAINKKLNDIIELLNGMNNSGNQALNGYYSGTGGINSLNSQLQATKDNLKKSADILQSSDMEIEAKKAMIDYTLEKNSSSRNMLGLYVFMNLVAGGLLFYLYRST